MVMRGAVPTRIARARLPTLPQWISGRSSPSPSSSSGLPTAGPAAARADLALRREGSRPTSTLLPIHAAPYHGGRGSGEPSPRRSGPAWLRGRAPPPPWKARRRIWAPRRCARCGSAVKLRPCLGLEPAALGPCRGGRGSDERAPRRSTASHSSRALRADQQHIEPRPWRRPGGSSCSAATTWRITRPPSPSTRSPPSASLSTVPRQERIRARHASPLSTSSSASSSTRSFRGTGSRSPPTSRRRRRTRRATTR
ncbi:unnamed protein product [Urochloa humidicola]